MGFVFAIIISIISSISSIVFTLKMYNGLKLMYEQDLVGANYVQTARIILLNIENTQKTFLLNENGKDSAKIIENIYALKKNFYDLIMRADPLFSSRLGKIYFSDATASIEKYFQIIDRLIEANKNNRKKSISISLNEANMAYKDLDAKLDRLDNIKQKKNLKFYSTAIIIFQTNLILIILILLISMIIRIYIYNRQKKNIDKLKH